ncbi:protein TOPAZ1 isoform X2 [Trachinotus anak]|uniref:protein TOPAZ1 isoform X2 n=1 Tax=Trachinotus anak TaxID=443729 RepID=UPI0039F2278D
MSDGSQSCLEVTFGGCSTCTSTVKEKCVHRKPCGQIGEPRKADAAQISSELLCERNEVETGGLESLTCQRVRVYCRKIQFSCARTYMSWPFSNSSRTLTAHAGTTACPAEPFHPSARDGDSPINQNQSGSLSSRTKDMFPNATAAHQVSHQNEERQEEDGRRIIAKRNGKGECNMSSCSSYIKNTEFSPHFMDTEETLASVLSDTASLSTPTQRGREPGIDTVLASSTPRNRPETNSSMSTPSPSALGLSDWETATTLSPTTSVLTPGGLSSLSTTPSSNLPSSFLPQKVKGVELAEAHSASMSLTSSSPNRIIKAVGKPLFYCEETQMTLCGSSPTSSSVLTNNSDSYHSCESSLLLPQDKQGGHKDIFIERSPPVLEPYYNTRPFNQKHAVAAGKDTSSSYVTKELFVETNSNELMLPPLLSPVTSPRRHSCTRVLPLSSSDEDEEEEEHINKYTSKTKMFPGHCMPQFGYHQNCEESFDHHQCDGHSNEELERVSSKLVHETSPSSHSSVGDMSDSVEEESQDETDHKDDLEQDTRSSEQVPLTPKVKTNLTSGALAEPCSSPSSDEGQPFADRGSAGSSPSEIAGSKRDKTKAEAAGGTQLGILDEFTAYEQDILLVDVIQDDPELFENLPEGGLLKLGPTRVSEATKRRPTAVVKTLSSRMDGASLEVEQRLTPVIVDFHSDSPDITEESNSRPWRPQCSSIPPNMLNNTWPTTDKQTRTMGQSDANNNHVNGGLERSQPIQTVNSSHNIPPLMTIRNGPRITNPANVTDFRRQKSNSYCRQYFSESLSCGFKMCRFQHVPVEGDERFCVETVTRFIKNPMCIQKARAVFTGYYQNNPPGVYFSMPVLLSLLWALLKAGMVSDVFSVLNVSLAHKIVPSYEFLLALFNFVREKGLTGCVPELIQLTFKMASAGLVLSFDCLDCVKNPPEFQQTVHPNSPVSVSGSHKLSSSASFPEYLNLAQSIVEIELCTKQEDWRRMGKVFRSVCQSSQHPNQVEQISGRIAIALLSESKDKLSLPFAAFAETVCQNEAEDLILSFLGRIGVSLMLRYHKTHQWAKGRRVVEVLSISKVSYSTLKGLFGNEDGASRCCLITVATELFLLSGSVEGALNILRENKWFLSSCSWPCEPADLDSRTRVLMRLAEKTSHRDTLEVLCNLPGIKEPNDLVDISRYRPLFNSHLQVCVDRQILPVASDTVDFMLSQNLAVDHTVLQILLHKLGKQNLWLRAREVFRHSLSAGYYSGVSAPPGFMALIVPCRLGEVELALTFEMFITVNATVILQLAENTTSCLSITLKRTQSGESEYLSAGSRLLSAACIPQPKLIVHYTAVNSLQEQVFTLDISSARRWLRHNHLWANEVWVH